MITDVNSEDRLVQQTFANHLRDALGWESVYAFNTETFGPDGTLGRSSERDVVLVRDLRAALTRLNPDIPESAASRRHRSSPRLTSRGPWSSTTVTSTATSEGGFRSTGVTIRANFTMPTAQVIDFREPVPNNRFLVVRELKIQGFACPTTTAAPTWSASSTACPLCSSN